MGKPVSINEGALDISSGEPRLIGSCCKDCGAHVFPEASGCSKCAGSNMERAILGTEGTLWAWTIQGFPPHSPPYLGETDPEQFESYGVGYVALPECKVEARLTESEPARLKNGMPMKLTTVPLCKDENGDEIVTFAFEPTE